MAVEMATFDLSFSTSGNTDVIDLTRQVLDRVAETDLEEGQVLLFVPGSTGAITTIEYEHGAVSDLKDYTRLAGSAASVPVESWRACRSCSLTQTTGA